MNPSALLQSFEQWRADGRDLVLATVYATEGSTYSKAGAHMLLDPAGHFRGMLSGGCLEGDLAERAAQVLDTDEPQCVTYDLTSSDEELWGLGVGCEGIMRVFLQPLTAGRAYEPFASIARAYAGDLPGAAAIVIESGNGALPPGAARVLAGDDTMLCGAGEATSTLFDDGLAAVLATRRARLERLDTAGGTVAVLFSCIQPPPRILILGGGLDAEPVVRLAYEMGWRVTLQDHRPAYIEKGDFRLAENVLQVPPASLHTSLDLARFDAVIVMSHHLQSDREYLRQLADTHIAYIGLLGPLSRRQRLVSDLGEAGKRLAGRLHGPAGLDIGGRGPASIALSIIAEMHRELMQNDV